MARTSKAKAFELTVNKVDSLVQLLRGKHVKRVVIDGIEIEFDTAMAAIHAAERKQEQPAETTSAKDAAGGSERLRQLLKEESEEALFWSAGK